MSQLRVGVFKPLSIAGLIGLGTIFVYARFIEPNNIVIEDVAIEIPGLASALEKLNVVFVSDLQVGDVGVLEKKLVERLRTVRPDLLLIGGDFVTVTYYMTDVLRNMATACSLLAEVPTTYGKYAVWGNNDFPEDMKDIAAASGIRVLENEWIRLQLPGGELTLIGLGDPVTNRTDWEATFREQPPDPLLMLSHSPDAFPTAAAHNIPVMLAGHTHGGQVRNPLTSLMPTQVLKLKPGTPPYRAGLYRSRRSTLYVTRGVGTSNAPFRFLCPPELTRVHLVPARTQESRGLRPETC